MKLDNLLYCALNFEHLSVEEGMYLHDNASTTELMFVANELRKIQKPDNIVTWIIDRNINITNACIANCKFCNFSRPPKHEEVYITTLDQYKEKIDEMFALGGEQLLLQGGHHPDLGLQYYADLFQTLKNIYPNLKLHALGPPEIAHICKLEQKSHKEVLEVLRKAGLDSLPGAGAEILSNRVRRLISNGKCSSEEWLEIMHTAHQLHITTSATMMFGHIETIQERFEHLVAIRETQDKKPENAKGFISFTPWPFQDDGTLLQRVKGVSCQVSNDEYIRIVALSRIMLPNIKNIQASWLTVGKEVAQLCLHAGANDFGSIMIEENVVSAAGAPHRFTASAIQNAIREAGFEPQLRNQQYKYISLPKTMKDQAFN